MSHNFPSILVLRQLVGNKLNCVEIVHRFHHICYVLCTFIWQAHGIMVNMQDHGYDFEGSEVDQEFENEASKVEVGDNFVVITN